MLNVEQLQFFMDHGYVVLEGFKPDHELAELKAAAARIVDAFDIDAQRSIFATGQDDLLDDYFLTSGDKIRCFLEPDAFDEQGALRHSKAMSINKIGHAMHDLDPTFDRFSRDHRLKGLMADLGVTQPRIWQSMYIYKQPHIGGEVAWHQDATYLFSEPQSVVGLWFALDDARVDNGCLWVANCGSRTPLRSVFRVTDGRSETVQLDPTPWPDWDDAVALEVEAGSLVCFHGLLPHYSAANSSDRPRHAYTLHVLDQRAAYAPDNWLQRGAEFPVRGFET